MRTPRDRRTPEEGGQPRPGPNLAPGTFDAPHLTVTLEEYVSFAIIFARLAEFQILIGGAVVPKSAPYHPLQCTGVRAISNELTDGYIPSEGHFWGLKEPRGVSLQRHTTHHCIVRPRVQSASFGPCAQQALVFGIDKLILKPCPCVNDLRRQCARCGWSDRSVVS